MARPCSICQHPQRASIEADRRLGVGLRPMMTKYHVGKDAILNHEKAHMPKRHKKPASTPSAKKPDSSQTVPRQFPDDHQAIEPTTPPRTPSNVVLPYSDPLVPTWGPPSMPARRDMTPLTRPPVASFRSGTLPDPMAGHTPMALLSKGITLIDLAFREVSEDERPALQERLTVLNQYFGVEW